MQSFTLSTLARRKRSLLSLGATALTLLAIIFFVSLGDSPDVIHSLEGKVTAVAISPNERHYAAVTANGDLFVINARQPTEAKRFRITEGPLSSLCFIQDDHLLLGTTDGRVLLWPIKDCDVLYSTRAHERPVVAVCASGTSKCVATQGERGVVKIWRLNGFESLEFIGELDGFQAGPTGSIAFLPSGHQLLATSPYHCQATLWDVNWARGIERIDSLGEPPPPGGDCLSYAAVTVCKSTNTIAIGSWNGRIEVWDLIEHRLVTSCVPYYGQTVTRMASSDSYFVACSQMGTLLYPPRMTIWNSRNLERHRSFVLKRTFSFFHVSGFSSIAMAQHSNVVLSGHVDGSLRIWRVDAM